MINTQTLKGNLINQDYSTAFTLNQGDKGVPFRVELLENGTPYTLQSTDIVNIEWLKPNGNPFLQECDINYGTTYIEFTTPEAIAQYSGSGSFNIIISNGDVRKGTIRREYKVVPTSFKPGSVSEDVITDAITELRELNATLVTAINNGDLNNYAKKNYVDENISNINASLEENANRINDIVEVNVADIIRKNPLLTDDEILGLIFNIDDNKNKKVIFPTITMHPTKTIEINLGRYSIEGKGTIFNFSNLQDECAIKIRNTVDTGRPTNYIKGIVIDGGTSSMEDTISKNKIGIKLDIDETDNAFNYVRCIEKCTIMRFKTGLFYGSKTYLIEFRDGYISQCDEAISIWDKGTATPDGGAVLTFVHCEIMHNNLAIKCNNPIASVYFNRCAIDYNNTYVILNNGCVFFTNCNLENGHENSSEYPFTINAVIQNKNKTLLSIDNCWIIHTSMKGTKINIESLFLNNNGNLILKNSVINQIKQNSLYLQSGNGDIVYKDNVSNYGNFILLNNESLMYDNDFEKTDDILDEIIFDFNTPLPDTILNLIVNDSHNTNLVKIEKTNEESKTGTKSLKVTKLSDTWGIYFNIVMPLSNNNCRHAIKFLYKEGAAQSNKNILEIFYCKKSKKYINNNYYTLIPMSNAEDAVKTVDINQSTTWNELTVTTDKKPPKYADSLVLRFWYKNFDKNVPYYYDNFEITEI